MAEQIVLISGITGRSGSYLLKRILNEKEQAYKYKAIVRTTSDTTLLDSAPSMIQKYVGDLHDSEFLDAALANVDVVLHIAGIGKSLPMVKAAVKKNVKRIILVHTTGIYSKYKSASAEYLHIEDEISFMLKDTDISLTILRPTMIYGSLDDGNISVFIKMVDKLPIFPVVKGAKFALQPVHHRDLGNAYFDVLTHPEITNNKNYVLSGLYPIDLIDILKTISKYLGKKRSFVSVPFFPSYFGACLIYFISFGNVDYREKVQRLIEPRAYDHHEAKKDFGYLPTDFTIGVKQEVEDYLKRK